MAKKQEGSISLARTGGILPDGVYKVKVDNMELKTGQKAPFFACRFKVDRRDSVIFENISTAESARFRMEAFLDAIEAPTSGAMTPAKFVAWCRGKTLYVGLTNESYKGKLKNVIGDYLLAEVAQQMMEEQATAPSTEEDFDNDDDDFDADDEDEDEDGDFDNGDEDSAGYDSSAPKDSLPF